MRYPSIFNDVLGPVMRGPSSSHTAASWRIGVLATQLLNAPLKNALIEFDEAGAWAPNYREQGTVMGMDGGLLGIEITDERIIDPGPIAKEKQITITYKVSRFPTDHPNTVRLTLESMSGKKLVLVAVSLGGGMFETRMVNGHSVHMQGDYYELLGIAHSNLDIQNDITPLSSPTSKLSWSNNSLTTLFQLRQSSPFSPDLIAHIEGIEGVVSVSIARPILPIISGLEQSIPLQRIAS